MTMPSQHEQKNASDPQDMVDMLDGNAPPRYAGINLRRPPPPNLEASESQQETAPSSQPKRKTANRKPVPATAKPAATDDEDGQIGVGFTVLIPAGLVDLFKDRRDELEATTFNAIRAAIQFSRPHFSELFGIGLRLEEDEFSAPVRSRAIRKDAGHLSNLAVRCSVQDRNTLDKMAADCGAPNRSAFVSAVLNYWLSEVTI